MDYVDSDEGGFHIIAFVVDSFSRRIVGWSASTNKRARFVLDVLEMALWQRERTGRRVERGTLIHHSVAGSPYTSFWPAAHLAGEGIAVSIGSVGDAYDNALMQSVDGLYKTELIKRQGPWRSLAEVELATAEWVDWYNHTRLYSELGHIPPAAYEELYYRQNYPTDQVTATT
jgi:putative transposase